MFGSKACRRLASGFRLPRQDALALVRPGIATQATAVGAGLPSPPGHGRVSLHSIRPGTKRVFSSLFFFFWGGGGVMYSCPHRETPPREPFSCHLPLAGQDPTASITALWRIHGAHPGRPQATRVCWHHAR